MEKSPVINPGADVGPSAPSVEQAAPGAVVCGAPGCGQVVVQPERRRRPRAYCSVACRSRANRARTADRARAALASAAGAAAPGPVPGHWPEVYRDLVRAADEVGARTRLYLEDTPADPAGAREAYLAELADLVEVLRERADAVHDAAAAAEENSRSQTPGRPADLPGPRGADGGVPADTASAGAAAAPEENDRPETPDGSGVLGSRLRDLVDRTLAAQQDQSASAAPAVPPSVDTDHAAPPVPGPAAPAGHSAERPRLAVPRQPRLRDAATVPDVVQLLDVRLFGEHWRLEGWSADPGIHLVTGEGHVVGSVQRDVPGLRPGWVPVYEEHFLIDAADGTVLVYDIPQDAAYIVHRAYLQQL